MTDSTARATKASFAAYVTVTVDMVDADPVKDGYHTHSIVPYRFELNYVQEAVEHEDWTEHRWRCDSADASGYLLLKPGPNGERRISGKAVGSAHWFATKADLSDEAIPELLRHVVNEYRPNGVVDAMNFEL